MTDKRLDQLSALTALDSSDLLYVVDVSDTTDGANGTSKKIQASSIGGVLPFDTVSDMVSSNALVIGGIAVTKGYTSAGDGGAASYRIVASATGTNDGGFYHDLTGITGQAELIHNGRVSIKWFGAVGNGTTDDTDALNVPFSSAAPDNLVIELVGSETYLQNGQISISSNNPTIIGNGATIKRGAAQTTTLSANAANGATTISVASASALNISAGDTIILVNTAATNGGQAIDEEAGPFTVDGVSGNDITLTTGIDLPADGSLDGGNLWPSGEVVMKVYNQIVCAESRSLNIFSTKFDGNRANNTVFYGWTVNGCIRSISNGTVNNCVFHSMPNETIFCGYWSTITGNTAYGLNGSFTHNSSSEVEADDNNTCYIITNNRIRDACAQSEAINGHDEGVFTFSSNAGKCVIDGNIVDGSGQAFAGHNTDFGEVVITGNLARNCKGVFALRPGSNAIGKSVVSGNTFETCGALIIANSSNEGRIADTGLGMDSLTISDNNFVNCRAYIRHASNFTVSGNTFTWEDGYSPAADQFTIGQISLDSETYQMRIDECLRYAITGNQFEDYNASVNEIEIAILYVTPADGSLPHTKIKTDASTTTDYYYYHRDSVINNNSVVNYSKGIGTESSTFGGNSSAIIGMQISNNSVSTKDAATSLFGIRGYAGVVIQGNHVVANANTTHGIMVEGVTDSVKSSINGEVVRGNTVVGNPTYSIRVGYGTANQTNIDKSWNMTVVNNVTDVAVVDNNPTQNVVSGNVQNMVTSTTIPVYPTRANSGWY